ncbi:MAG: YncE family protein [Pseudonocardiaceae bacterium]
MRPLVVVGLIGALVTVAACSSDGGQGDPLQIAQNPAAATPAASPEQARTPAGTVVAAQGDATAVAIQSNTRTVAVAVTDQDRPAVLFYALDDLDADPQRLAVPGPIERLMPDQGEGFVGTVPGEDLLVHLSPAGGVVGETSVEGAPVSVANRGAQRLVALRGAAAIAVLEHEQQVKTISGEIQSADQVLSVGEGAVVLDRMRSALFEVDVDAGTIGLGLRAGQGATNAVIDRYDRVLVTDTRAGSLLAFSVDPLLLRQRYPVPGGVYAIAYDSTRDLVWVTLTARNQVVGFDVGGGEPQEKLRFDTVRQPNSVTVDERTGRVFVASAAGEGLQVIEP